MTEKFDKSQLKTLCRGNRTDRGWTRNAEGNWVPSVHDRRRLGTAHVEMVVQMNGLPVVPMPLAMNVLVNHHSTGDEDAKALLENFGRWLNAS